MGRMYGHGKGISRSIRPFRRTPPAWCKTSPTEVADKIVFYAKKGIMPSQIGVLLRDSQSVPLVQAITGQRVVRILRRKGMAPQYPEDLYNLMKRAVNIRKHMEKFRQDKDSKFRLILTESKIHRLARYYRRTKKIPANFKYTASSAGAIVA